MTMTYGTGALGGEARPEAFGGGGGGGLIQSTRIEQGAGGGGKEGEAGGGGGGFVEGYEETGFCLNGQTCNAQEYVYLQLL
jgi:hypothetical protein